MKKLNDSPLWCALACLLGHGRASATDIPLDLIQEQNGGNSPSYRLGINVGLSPSVSPHTECASYASRCV